MSNSSAILIPVFFALCLSSIPTVVHGKDFQHVDFYRDGRSAATRNNGNQGRMRTDLGNGNAVRVNVTSGTSNGYRQAQAQLPEGQVSTSGTALASKRTYWRCYDLARY